MAATKEEEGGRRRWGEYTEKWEREKKKGKGKREKTTKQIIINQDPPSEISPQKKAKVNQPEDHQANHHQEVDMGEIEHNQSDQPVNEDFLTGVPLDFVEGIHKASAVLEER